MYGVDDWFKYDQSVRILHTPGLEKKIGRRLTCLVRTASALRSCATRQGRTFSTILRTVSALAWHTSTQEGKERSLRPGNERLDQPKGYTCNSFCLGRSTLSLQISCVHLKCPFRTIGPRLWTKGEPRKCALPLAVKYTVLQNS